MPDLTKIAVVMVGMNSRRWLEPALASLLNSSGQGTEFTLDITYADNSSDDGSVAYIRTEFPSIRLIENTSNRGFSAANNQAIRAALDDRADYVFLVNPDTYTPAGLIGHLTAFMQKFSNYGIVGPLQWRYSLGEPLKTEANSWTRDALAAGEQHTLAMNRAGLPGPADPGTPRAPRTLEHAYVQGAALFARADMLRTIGLLDEIYHSFYEDTELCRRARLGGWRVALLTDCGIHHYGGGGGGSPYRRLQMMRNKYFYLLTDVDLRVDDMAAIAGGWLRQDLAGHGLGGPSALPQAWTDLSRSAAWLLSSLPTALRRRRVLAKLRASVTEDARNATQSIPALRRTTR
jgi:hypothetical protein